jgi:hypothetical protein
LPCISTVVVASALVSVPSGIVMFWSCPGIVLPSASTPKPCTKSPEVVVSWLFWLRTNDPSRVNFCSLPWTMKNPSPSIARSVGLPVVSSEPVA